jgi:hypothetical protein
VGLCAARILNGEVPSDLPGCRRRSGWKLKVA